MSAFTLVAISSDLNLCFPQVEAQLDYGPGSEIGAGWKIGVTWSRKLGFKMAATELGYLITKSPFWLSVWHDISIFWHGGKESSVWYVLPTMPSIRGLRWCRYSTEKCLPDSHLPFVYVVILSISPILPPRTQDIIAHWQVALPARPPSRWLPHMILTEPCCSFPDIPNMGWHNKKIF